MMDASLIVMTAGWLDTLGVVPVMVGPLQALMAVLPGILAAVGGMLIAMFKPSAVKRFFQLLWAQKVAVAMVAVTVGAAVYFGGELLSAGQATAGGGAEVEGAADWGQFRGGLTRRGFVPGSDEPVRGGLNWAFNRPFDTFYSSPTVVGNRIYVASAQVSMFNRQGNGAVFALDADTGGVVWRGGPSDYRATFSSPSVVGNRLAIGEGLHETHDARVVVLDLDRDGAVLWTYRMDSHGESSPIIYNGRVYIGAGNDGYYCFELEPDEQGEAQVVWHVSTDDYPDASGAPTAYDGVVYVPLGRAGGNGVAALDADTGDELWRVDTKHAVFSGPTISEEHGLLFVGTGTGNIIQTAEEALPRELERLRERGWTEEQIDAARENLGPAGGVWAIDMETQEVRWRFDAEQIVIGQVAVDGDRVYFGSRDGHLYCVSTETGELAGKWNANDAILASPAVADEHVYVVTSSGFLYALDKRRLEPVWDAPVGPAPSISSPTVARGRVFVGSSGNGLLSLGETGTQRVAPLWAGERGGPGASGWPVGSLMPARANYAWGYNETPVADGGKGGMSSATPAVVSRPETEDEPAQVALFAPMTSDDAHGLVRLDFTEGLRARPTRTWLAATDKPIARSPVVVDDTVFAVQGEAGDENRLLQSYALDDGAPGWQRSVAADASGTLTATRRHVLVADEADKLTSVDPRTGEPRWSAAVGRLVGEPYVDGDLVLTATAEPARLAALDLETGIVLWSEPVDSEPSTGTVVVGDMAWFGAADGVHGHDLFRGTPRYKADSAAVVDRLVIEDDRIAWNTEAGVVHVIDGVTGEEETTIDDVLPTYAPMIGDGGLLYWVDGSLERYDFDSGQRQYWTRITAAWPGLLETPPIAVEQHLLFGSGERGLVCIRPEN